MVNKLSRDESWIGPQPKNDHWISVAYFINGVRKGTTQPVVKRQCYKTKGRKKKIAKAAVNRAIWYQTCHCKNLFQKHENKFQN